MATMATNTPALSAASSGLLSRLSLRFAEQRLYRATRMSLSQLSDRQLADIGLTRGLIEDAARGAATSL